MRFILVSIINFLPWLSISVVRNSSFVPILLLNVLMLHSFTLFYISSWIILKIIIFIWQDIAIAIIIRVIIFSHEWNRLCHWDIFALIKWLLHLHNAVVYFIIGLTRLVYWLTHIFICIYHWLKLNRGFFFRFTSSNYRLNNFMRFTYKFTYFLTQNHYKLKTRRFHFKIEAKTILDSSKTFLWKFFIKLFSKSSKFKFIIQINL